LKTPLWMKLIVELNFTTSISHHELNFFIAITLVRFPCRIDYFNL